METPAATMDTARDITPEGLSPPEERRLWKKLARVVARISFAEDLIAAVFCVLDRNTPVWVRTTLLGAVAYFVLPVDAVPDFIVALGFTDDAAVLATALGAVGQHLRPEHRAAAKRKLDQLLG